MNKEEEKAIINAAREFAEVNDVHFDDMTEAMICNSIRETVASLQPKEQESAEYYLDNRGLVDVFLKDVGGDDVILASDAMEHFSATLQPKEQPKKDAKWHCSVSTLEGEGAPLPKEQPADEDDEELDDFVEGVVEARSKYARKLLEETPNEVREEVKKMADAYLEEFVKPHLKKHALSTDQEIYVLGASKIGFIYGHQKGVEQPKEQPNTEPNNRTLKQNLQPKEQPKEQGLQRLWEWLNDDNREPANTKFTSGLLRNVAREIQYRIKFEQPKEQEPLKNKEK